tara:strand:- start:849 stop:1592 length:744 start_codon:yes stop_codon:yes gene_type:complete
MNYKLTIVIATLNSERHLNKTLQSLQKQVFKNFIIYIADGGSRDNTLSLFEKFKLNYKIISRKDISPEDAVNKCFKKIKTDYYTIVGSDDYYKDKYYLYNLIKSIEKNNADIIFPGLLYVNGRYERLTKQNYNFDVINYRPIYPGYGWLAKRKISKILFNLKYKIASDYEFLIRVSKKKYQFYRENKAVYCFRLGGTSSKNYFRSLKEVKEIALNHNGPKTKIYFYFCYLNIKHRLKIFLQKFINII